ncbi:copper amine oxidase [Streptosporangium carneum]|uniref:copper amine oxidase n=1 Tax=Streptosporangium carneum TaxID=47481 RepID=UPI0022F2C40C|nr:copper amine oxidase [Streptosporangium carneum]
MTVFLLPPLMRFFAFLLPLAVGSPPGLRALPVGSRAASGPRRLRVVLALALCCATAFPGAGIAGAVAGTTVTRGAQAAPTPPCSASYRVDRTLPNGARWRLCWEMRNIEGLTLGRVVYTPRGGTPVSVLRSAALAQIHVPYDKGSPRFHDIGAMGYTAIPLQAADCPGGERREQFVCVTTRPRGHAYLKSDEEGSGRTAQGSDLVVFAAFQLGWYTYIVEWAFSDDGAIAPRVGATGSLAGFTTTPRHGWPIGVGSKHFEASHTHNVFWRLDFDIQGRTGDVVEQYDFTGAGTARRTIKRTVLTRETRAVNGRARWWRVVDRRIRNADRHPVSWEIENSGSAEYRGPANEAFTRADLYVTDYRSCERLATTNPAPRCAKSVDRYVNGERLTDPVLWVNVDYHHVARDEDSDPMPTHWQGFRITPRDVTARNPY